MQVQLSNISFNGFDKNLKKKVYSRNYIEKNARIKPEKLFFIDRLPQCLNFPNAKDFKKNFENFSSEFRLLVDEVGLILFYKYGGNSNAYEDDSAEVDLQELKHYSSLDEIKILKENTDKLFKKYKFISDNQNVMVKACNDNNLCNYGFGYQIIIENSIKNSQESLFLKIFFKDYKSHQYNGKIPEITRSIYLNHNMGKHKNFPAFYWGDISHDAPYIISEYIEKEQKNTYLQYPHYLLGLEFNDHSKLNRNIQQAEKRNVIGDYYIDAGKIIPINSLAYNNIARIIAKKIFRTPKNQKYILWQKTFKEVTQNAKHSDNIAGLVYGIKFLPDEYQKECYMQILNSNYANNKEVILAILCQPDLVDLILPISNDKKEFLHNKYLTLLKNSCLSSKEKDYLNKFI